MPHFPPSLYIPISPKLHFGNTHNKTHTHNNQAPINQNHPQREIEEHERINRSNSMGNCQAIDAATLVIQHPSGKLDKLYWPVTASEIMRTNPGHYVALLITTTVFHPAATAVTNKTAVAAVGSKDFDKAVVKGNENGGGGTVRVTRVKLLRPTDILALGHAYRLISSQEVMKGMGAKKQAKMKKDGLKSENKDIVAVKDSERLARKSQLQTDNQGAKRERQRSSRAGTVKANSGTKRAGTWRPSLNSISEAGG
ncbi:hypothetical protein Drorol1_Dr00004489 [Drosera rotundifolia]